MSAIDTFCPKCEKARARRQPNGLRPDVVIPAGYKLRDAMKLYVLVTFRQYGYNKARTARALAISLRTMRNKFEEWDFTANEVGVPSNPELIEQVDAEIRRLSR